MPAIISSPATYSQSSPPPPPSQKRPFLAFTRKQPLTDSLNRHAIDTVLEPSERPSKRQTHQGDVLERSISPASESIRPVPIAVSKPPRRHGAFVDIDSDEEDARLSQLPEPPMPKSVNQAIFHDSDIYAPTYSPPTTSNHPNRREIRNCAGRLTHTRPRIVSSQVTYEQMIAERSTVKAGRAKRSYYGIDIQELIRDAKKDIDVEKTQQSRIIPEKALPSIESTTPGHAKKSLLWTEKYRAKRFFDLVGDDRTHRDVLRWLKGWDPVVFGKTLKRKAVAVKNNGLEEDEKKQHRKILMLTGPPGLGKTTLAHVCAVQAGYEVMEVNASDDRTARIVRERIRTSVGTESVKHVGTSTKAGSSKIVRPTAVIIDEVDGVTTGSGESGEGGFIKALIDLINLDAKNMSDVKASNAYSTKKRKKVDDFRLMRPIILICNDVYHPSLRPLRQSGHAEIIHIRKPPMDAVANRMQAVFEKEGVSADKDGVRKLCEAAWGISSGPEARHDSSSTGEGDIRSLLVIGEWVAAKLRNAVKPTCLTKKWVEVNILGSLQHGGGSTRNGGGGSKEVVSRVFITGAGFPKPIMPSIENKKNKTFLMNDVGAPISQLHANEAAKKAGMERLRELVNTSGETDRIIHDLFTTYPTQPFNDDSLLSKPNAAYEWLHFSDSLSKRVWSEQDWELMPYLSQPVLAYHHLFASSARRAHTSDTTYRKKWDQSEQEEEPLPFTGPQADFKAKEAEKVNRAILGELQSALNPSLLRSFRSVEDVATDLLPYLIRMLSPDVKPIIVGGSGTGDVRGIASVRKADEKEMVRRAVDVMSGVGIRYERGRLESQLGERDVKYVYRMEPPLDEISQFPTKAPSKASLSSSLPQRYAIRQVLDQEYQKSLIIRSNTARQARFRAGGAEEAGLEDTLPTTGDTNRYDFSLTLEDLARRNKDGDGDDEDGGVWERRKKDFFGRDCAVGKDDGGMGVEKRERKNCEVGKVWVTFHEGFSNAVRKPVTIEELMRGL